MDTTSLTVGVLAGAVGFPYFIYGKKYNKQVMMISGIVLCVYPYFIGNHLLLILIGIVLTLLPLFIRH